MEEIEARAVDNGPWDGAAALSSCAKSDDPAAAYAKVCAGRKAGDPALQSSWALPHHDVPGAPPNADGVRNALSRLPQTDGLTNRAAAEAHLQAHLANDVNARAVVWDDDEPAIQVRDLAKRELDVRLLPWGKVIQTRTGTEEFRRGAFDGTDASKVLLMGLEHEVHLGVGSGGEPKMTRHPVGKGIAYSDQPDGAHMTFRVAKTQRGDEVLSLAEEGIVTGVSPEFVPVAGGSIIERRDGRRHEIYTKAELRGASTTYRPAYGEQAAVLAVRSQAEGDAPMADQKAPDAGAEEQPEAPAISTRAVDDAVARVDAGLDRLADRFVERIEKLEERARSSFTVPGIEAPKASLQTGEWMDLVLDVFTGERVGTERMRAAEDVITSDNIGVVPPAYMKELIGVIDPSRPFMSSTRRLPVPANGIQLIVPVITQRPAVAKQSSEKASLTTQATHIGTTSFDMITKGGYGDLSLQLLKRSDPSFLDLYLQLLAEAYAIECEAEAVDALLHATEPLNPDPLDPEDLSLGDAYTTSFDAIRRPPDTIWLSTEAIGAFIDAKATTTNQPLYPGLQASATAGGGITGTISGLRAVHVPALDLHGSYAIVGPSNGFAWAEDGTYTLQVDVPAKAGRDVALVGMVWFAPWYPAAFSIYNVAS